MKGFMNGDTYPSSKNELWRFSDIKSFCENSITEFLNRGKLEAKKSTVLEGFGFVREEYACLRLDKNGVADAGFDVSQCDFKGELGSKLETLVVENTKHSTLNLKGQNPKILIELASDFGFSPSFLNIDLEENAQAEILILQETSSLAFVDSLLGVKLGKNSKLKISFVNNTKSESLLYSKVNFNLGEYARLDLHSIQEGASPSRVEYLFDIAEKHAHVEATCFMKNYDACLHNLNTYQMHKVGDTSSNLTLRNVLGKDAKATFAGFVKIEKDAQNTSAKQSCKTLLLDKTARINALPILEIEANDVECSHGCAVSMPDEEQVFYLRARGLSLIQAKELIADGFVDFSASL